MAAIHDFKLFDTHCGGCGKLVKTTATNKLGEVPEVFCNRSCETTGRLKKRTSKNIVTNIRFL